MAMARQEDSTVMLSAAKHLDAQRDRPFAAAQGDSGGGRFHHPSYFVKLYHRPSLDAPISHSISLCALSGNLIDLQASHQFYLLHKFPPTTLSVYI